MDEPQPPLTCDPDDPDDPMREHFEYWIRGKAFFHLPAVRNAMFMLLAPNPETGVPIVPRLRDGMPDYDTAYRYAIADLNMGAFH